MGQLKIKDDASTKEKVVDATIKLIIEEGYNSITWRKISRKANLSPGTLTYYFKNIDEIVFLAFNVLIEKEISYLLNIVNKSNNITDFCNNITELVLSEYSKTNYLLLNVELSCLALRNEAYKKLYRTWMEKSQSAYQIFLDKNKSMMLDSFLEGVMLHNTISGDPYPKKYIVETIQRLFGA